jgi:polyisoprenyl-phosphate glycosyltransferase
LLARDPTKSQVRLSVVVPVYRCCGCLEELCRRLTEVLSPLDRGFEIILVDDRSPDGAWDSIVALQARYQEIRGVRLSRNFGQHVAITAGLAQACGDYTVVMDCDLQDPPELIPELLAKALQGFDVVLARRIERHHSVFRVLASKLYFRLLRLVTGQNIDGNLGAFSLLSRKVVAAFLEFNEPGRHYLFILCYIGFHVGTIDYIQASRVTGKSSYSLTKLIRHAIDGFLFQSTGFLIWIIACGLLFGSLGVLLAAYFCYQYFNSGSVPGWTSVAVLILVCSGVVLSSVGVIGLYVGKIFDQTKHRPLYIIDVISDGRSAVQSDDERN